MRGRLRHSRTLKYVHVEADRHELSVLLRQWGRPSDSKTTPSADHRRELVEHDIRPGWEVKAFEVRLWIGVRWFGFVFYVLDSLLSVIDVPPGKIILLLESLIVLESGLVRFVE